jgi:opacity protein-like surface antigen
MGVRSLVVVAAVVVLGLPPAAQAQAAAGSGEPRGDLFAGYSYLRSGDASLHGGMVSLAWRLTGPLSLVAEAASHRGTVDGEDVTSTSLLGGARFSFGGRSFRPFLQALAGAARTSRGISIFGVDITEKSTGFAGAAGAGVDFGVGSRWAVRVQGDYRVAKEDTETVKDPRVSVGAVLRF